MPNQEPASVWMFGNSSVRVGTQGLFRPYLKTFVPPFPRPDWLPLGLRGWWQGSIWWKHVSRKNIFKWDFVKALLLNAERKILFVIKLQTSKQQDTPKFRFAILHWRNRPIKMWETHPNDYWVFSKMVDLLSLTPRSYTLQDAGWVSFPPWGRSGCQIPYPRALH